MEWTPNTQTQRRTLILGVSIWLTLFVSGIIGMKSDGTFNNSLARGLWGSWIPLIELLLLAAAGKRFALVWIPMLVAFVSSAIIAGVINFPCAYWVLKNGLTPLDASDLVFVLIPIYQAWCSAVILVSGTMILVLAKAIKRFRNPHQS